MTEVPQVTWLPNLNTNGIERSYTIWGKVTVGSWQLIVGSSGGLGMPDECRPSVLQGGVEMAICANRGFVVSYAPFEGGVAEWLKAAVC